MDSLDLCQVELLERLAATVANQAREYAQLLRSQTKNTSETNSPVKLQNSRIALLDSTQELHDVVQGPVDYVRKELSGHCNLIGLHAAYRYDLQKKVPLEGDISYHDLAELCDVDEDKLRRIMRYAITRRIFKEPRIGYVSHSPESLALVKTPLLMDYIGVLCEDMWPAAAMTVPAMVKWPHSEDRSHSGFALAERSGISLYDTFRIEPERAARFARFMTMMSAAPFHSYDYLCDAYDWATVSTVVDIGAGKGDQGVALAEAFPHLQVTIQDLPSLGSSFQKFVPAELQDRVLWQGHDFFDEQPVRDADVYYFRWIFHDWPDVDCIRLLRALIPALKPGAKILISDNLLPVAGSVPRYLEWAMRVSDVVMMETNNAKDRDLGQYKTLLLRADKRFRLQEVKRVEGWRMACLVITWDG